MVTEGRPGQFGITDEETHKEAFRGSRNVLYLDRGGGYTLCIYANMDLVYA